MPLQLIGEIAHDQRIVGSDLLNLFFLSEKYEKTWVNDE